MPTQPLDQYLSASLSAPVSHYITTCQLLDQHLSAALSAPISCLISPCQPLDQRLSAACSSGVELGHRAPSLCAPFGTPTSDLLGPQGWALPAFCWCFPVSEVSSAFRGQTYHGMSVPRSHTVPWRRLEPGRPDLVGKQTFLMGWWSQAACLGLLSQDPSPPQGPPALKRNP